MSLRAVLGSYRLVVFSLWPAVFWVLLHGVQLPERYPQVEFVTILDIRRLDMIGWECYQLFSIYDLQRTYWIACFLRSRYGVYRLAWCWLS